MPKKKHPSELNDEKVFLNASYFVVYWRLGSEKYREEIKTFPAAVIDLLEQRKRNSRAILCAVNKAGRSAIVPQHFIDAEIENPTKEKTNMKTYSKKSNAVRAAKAAGYEVGGFEIVKSKTGYGWKPAKDAHKDGTPIRASEKAMAKVDKKIKAKAPAATKSKAVEIDGVRYTGKYAAQATDAQKGKLPSPPDFSAETHKRFREKLDGLVKLAKAGDVTGLKKVEINPTSSSPKAMNRYRNLAIVALKAKKAA